MNEITKIFERDFEKEKLLIQRASDLAILSIDNGGGPFGCVITDLSYNVIAEDHNHVTLNNDPTAHAEISTIRQACTKLNNFTLQDCILFTSCEPCPMCLSAIYWARIHSIYYNASRYDAMKIGFDDNFIYNEISKKNEDRHIPIYHITSSSNIKEFDMWTSHTNKLHY